MIVKFPIVVATHGILQHTLQQFLLPTRFMDQSMGVTAIVSNRPQLYCESDEAYQPGLSNQLPIACDLKTKRQYCADWQDAQL